MDECEKRCKTIMIGALSKFEESFGALWGHGKNDDDNFTDDENYWYDLWMATRTNVLDLGNEQIAKYNKTSEIKIRKKR